MRSYGIVWFYRYHMFATTLHTLLSSSDAHACAKLWTCMNRRLAQCHVCNNLALFNSSTVSTEWFVCSRSQDVVYICIMPLLVKPLAKQRGVLGWCNAIEWKRSEYLDNRNICRLLGRPNSFAMIEIGLDKELNLINMHCAYLEIVNDIKIIYTVDNSLNHHGFAYYIS